ncbi:hypothetical protein [Parapedobacter sp.]|uniref:hypothetical protein n=1 Tax=Parapedobacter sp. TaxID=1958893 RepID=UPI002D80222F|nr:hypothetical protein [Parapedobacter sp.]
MLRQEELKVILDEQQVSFYQKKDLIARNAMDSIQVTYWMTSWCGISQCDMLFAMLSH